MSSKGLIRYKASILDKKMEHSLQKIKAPSYHDFCYMIDEVFTDILDFLRKNSLFSNPHLPAPHQRWQIIRIWAYDVIEHWIYITTWLKLYKI